LNIFKENIEMLTGRVTRCECQNLILTLFIHVIISYAGQNVFIDT